jgi:hypothetical protein
LVLAFGVGLYFLGWVYMPDMPLFRNWVTRNEQAVSDQDAQRQIQGFVERRRLLVDKLSPECRARYQTVVGICQDIERATKEGSIGISENDPRLRKLDELMWTYLRLLVMQGSLESYLQTESEQALPKDIEAAQQEIAAMENQIKILAGKGEKPEAKIRVVESKKERLATLTKRLSRIGDAKDHQALVVAEQDRLVEQIKLLRADALATHNTDTLTARIDATVEQLNETNRMMSQMDQFKDLVSDDMPLSSGRLGFAIPSTDDKQEAIKRPGAERLRN